MNEEAKASLIFENNISPKIIHIASHSFIMMLIMIQQLKTIIKIRLIEGNSICRSKFKF